MRKIPRPHASERAIVAEKAFDLICMVKYHGGVCGYNQSQVVLYWMAATYGRRDCSTPSGPAQTLGRLTGVWKWTAPAIMVNASMVNAGRAYFRRRIFANFFCVFGQILQFQNPFKYIGNSPGGSGDPEFCDERIRALLKSFDEAPALFSGGGEHGAQCGEIPGAGSSPEAA